ncbi:hypothetical protein D3C72_1884460 [compost metagenome]
MKTKPLILAIKINCVLERMTNASTISKITEQRVCILTVKIVSTPMWALTVGFGTWKIAQVRQTKIPGQHSFV